jgi:class 3 adenylate cyclase
VATPDSDPVARYRRSFDALDAAAPGEILVSATTAGLARDAGITFADRGEHELRGLSGTRQLFAVQ